MFLSDRYDFNSRTKYWLRSSELRLKRLIISIEVSEAYLYPWNEIAPVRGKIASSNCPHGRQNNEPSFVLDSHPPKAAPGEEFVKLWLHLHFPSILPLLLSAFVTKICRAIPSGTRSDVEGRGEKLFCVSDIFNGERNLAPTSKETFRVYPSKIFFLFLNLRRM